MICPHLRENSLQYITYVLKEIFINLNIADSVFFITVLICTEHILMISRGEFLESVMILQLLNSFG